MTDSHPSAPGQLARADRSRRLLRERGVPEAPAGAAPALPDEANAVLRPVREVARRVRVLQCVVQRAEAAPRDVVLRIMTRGGLWEAATAVEKRLLESEVVDDAEGRRLVWLLESMWTLMWSMGHVPELVWPGTRCDIARLGKLLHPKEGLPDLAGTAEMRSPVEVFDAIDLLARLDLAVRGAEQRGESIPSNLDWSAPGELLPAGECPGAKIVAHRLKALRWLVGGPLEW